MSTDTRTKSQVVFFIDQQKFTVEDREYTVRELLGMAGENPAETTLARRHGNDLERFTDLDQKLTIKDGTHFVVLHNGPTPVS